MTATVRAYAASPAFISSLAGAIAIGGGAAAYPGAFLAEPLAPGVLGGALLGLVGGGFTAAIWCAPAALWLGAGRDTSGVRVVLHVAGAGVGRRRGGELAAVGALLAGGLVFAAAGGMISALAQSHTVTRHLTGQAPQERTTLLALAAACAPLLAWALGIAIRSAALGVIVYAAAVAISFSFAGLGYFAGWAKVVTVYLPFGSVMPSLTSQFVSRQYTANPSMLARGTSATAWAALIVAAAAFRTTRSVR